MKKTLKELLWFVIPTVLIVAVYALTYALANSRINTPKWFGTKEYFLLFLKSPDFAQAVFNTALCCIVPALVMAIVLFIVQLFVKMRRPLYYGIMATATTLSALCIKLLYFGYSNSDYSVDTIIAKPKEITAIDVLKSITLHDVLQSLLIAIIACFVFWTVEQIVTAVKKKRKA